MTGRILALIDGSIYSQSVCEHAVWAAQRLGAPVDILHVLGRREAPATTDLSGSIRLGARTKLLEELAELDAQRARLNTARGRAILEDARAIVDAGGIDTITTRLRHGDIVETVAEQDEGTDLIVIGKRGEAADFAKGHLGSNLERIVRASRRPVLVAARAFKPIGRVLMAYDGGPTAMRAVDTMARSPLFTGLAVHLVTVAAPAEAVTRALDAARAMLRAAAIEATAEALPGDPPAVLGQLVDSAPFDLLVMGAYSHSRVRTFVIGSTTTEMMRSCKVPVLLFR